MPTRPTWFLGLVLVAAGVLTVVQMPAGTQAGIPPDRTEIVPVVGAATPPLPAAVLVRSGHDGDGLVVVNATDVPLAVAGPDGRDFLRVSAAGVETDAAAPFTYLSRAGLDVDVALPPGADAEAPPNWRKVSSGVSWEWRDPRLRPVAGLPPVGGRPDSRQVLARWSIPLRYGAVPAVLDGTLEARPAPGPLRLAVDPPPAGVTVVAAPGGLTVAAPAGVPVEIRGIEGEEFLRHTPAGWEISTDSITHRLDLLAAGRPVPSVSGWRSAAGGHAVTWADPRLDPGPGATVEWRIPIRLASGPAELTGSASRLPDGMEHAEPERLDGAALVSAIVFLAAALALLVCRDRRLAAPEPPSARRVPAASGAGGAS